MKATRITKKDAAAISLVVSQVITAMGEKLRTSADDPISDIHPNAPFLHSSEPWAVCIREHIFSQMIQNKGAGQRFDRAMKDESPTKMAESAFLFMHFSFDPGQNTVPVDPNEMTGFIRYSDENISVILTSWIGVELDANFVRAIRRKFDVGKIPKRFLISKWTGR